MWQQIARQRRQVVELPLPPWLRRALAADSELWLIPVIALPVVFAWRRLLASWVDYDYWWHVAVGDWIIDNRRLPGADPFSWTHAGQEFIATEWLSEVILALTERIGGYAGTMLLVTLVASAGFWRLVQGARYYGLSWRAACGLMLLWGGIPLWALTVRPQVFGWALLGVLFAELAAYETGRRRRLWLLPPLFILWINLHLSALIGVGFLAVFLLGRVVSGRIDRHLLIVAALCLPALMVNPYGPNLLIQAIRFARPGAIYYDFINEYQRPTFAEARAFWLATPMALVAFWYLIRRWWAPAWLSVLVLGTLVMSLRAERYIPLYGIVLFPFAGWLVWQWAQAGVRARMAAPKRPDPVRVTGRISLPRSVMAAPPRRYAPFRLRTRGLVMVGLGTVLLMALVQERGGSQFGREPKPWGFPTATVQALIDQYPRARLFNSYSYGGYLINKLHPHGIKVFIDGRADMYSDALIRDWLSIFYDARDWQDYFAARGINAVLVERNSPLARALDEAPAWNVAAVDDVSALWIRAIRTQACAREPALRAAPEASGQTTVEFLNGGSAPFLLFRLDEAGARQAVATVPPGQRTTLPTYETEPWVATDISGACLAVFQPLSIPSSITLMPLAPPRPPGTWLAIDTFDDPAKAILPDGIADRWGYAGYADGEYVVARTNRSSDGPWTVYLPGAYTNTSLNVTARLAGETDRRLIELRCRAERLPNGGLLGYALRVDPSRNAYAIVRYDGRPTVVLTEGRSPAIRPPLERNDLEFTCMGDRLTANINGVSIAIASDTRYTSGQQSIGLAGNPGVTGAQEVRFDDLVVTQR